MFKVHGHYPFFFLGKFFTFSNPTIYHQFRTFSVIGNSSIYGGSGGHALKLYSLSDTPTRSTRSTRSTRPTGPAPVSNTQTICVESFGQKMLVHWGRYDSLRINGRDFLILKAGNLTFGLPCQHSRISFAMPESN